MPSPYLSSFRGSEETCAFAPHSRPDDGYGACHGEISSTWLQFFIERGPVEPVEVEVHLCARHLNNGAHDILETKVEEELYRLRAERKSR